MKPKIGLVTLGAHNIKKAKEFYKGLGFIPKDEDNNDMVMLQGEGVWLGLYSWEALAKDAQVDSVSKGFRGVTLAHLEPTKKGVDSVIEEARSLGAIIVKEPRDVFWGGYSGYFTDLDGHLWEIAMNPFTDLT